MTAAEVAEVVCAEYSGFGFELFFVYGCQRKEVDQPLCGRTDKYFDVVKVGPVLQLALGEMQRIAVGPAVFQTRLGAVCSRLEPFGTCTRQRFFAVIKRAETPIAADSFRKVSDKYLTSGGFGKAFGGLFELFEAGDFLAGTYDRLFVPVGCVSDGLAR